MNVSNEMSKIIYPRSVDKIIAALKESAPHLKDSAPWMLNHAATALGKIGKLAVDPLIAALKDSNDLVREHAAEALGKIGDPRAIQPLITALRDSDIDVRREAAAALKKITDARALPRRVLLEIERVERENKDRW
jgi:HEAT repeat protein